MLRICYPSGREETIPLVHLPFRIGTGDDCDLKLAGGEVSRHQALITREAGGYQLRDVGTSRGIRWNGQVVRSRILRNGDRFEFGSPTPCQVWFLSPSPATPDRDLRNLKMLMDITRAINSSLMLEELLQKILEGVLQVTGAERGLVLLGEESGDLRLAACRQGGKPAFPERDPRISFSVATEVARTGRPISVKDAQTHEDYRRRESIMNLRLKTILCVPMKIQDRTIGVLYMDHRGIVEGLVPTDFQLLESLAATAAIAIENARLVEAKVQTERLSAVGQMASSLIHDIRGPITILQGFAELLKKQDTLDEKGRRYADSILREIQRIGAMATEVLEYSRGEVLLNRSPRTVRQIVEDILPLLEIDLERSGIRLELDLDVPDRIAVDPIKMGRVLFNLASNAVDAMEAGGRLRISARTVPPDLLLEVADTGCGIPEALREKIFQPFFSHGKAHGTGLGMAIVKKVVEQHGGRIEVESEAGRGTTVRLTIPLANENPERRDGKR